MSSKNFSAKLRISDVPQQDVRLNLILGKQSVKVFQQAKLKIQDNILKMLSITADHNVIIIDTSVIKLHKHGYDGKETPQTIHRNQ